MNHKIFAKTFESVAGQILVTRTKYENGYVVSLQFNDDEDDNANIHNLNMMFADNNKTCKMDSQNMFDNLDEVSALFFILQAIAKSKQGITEGNINEINDHGSALH